MPDVWLVVSGQRMNDRIVGICRFSFLGHGDWIGMRSDAATRSDRLERQIGMLYAEDRLARRFAAFQTMLLPSIAAQTDGDFELWILTSPELPAAWLARLRALCAPVPQIRIIVSDERTTEDALAAPLAEAAGAAGGPLTQFRVDDDDALSRHFIARLRQRMLRFADMLVVAISMAAGLILRRFDAEPVSYWRSLQRFIGIGVAVRQDVHGLSVFQHNHFDLPRELPAFSDPGGLNYVHLRWDEGDSSIPARQNWSDRHIEIGPEEFGACLVDDFPFLIGADLGFIAEGAAIAAPVLASPSVPARPAPALPSATPARDRIIGICRFSFLGRDDWVGTRPPARRKQAKGRQGAEARQHEQIMARIPQLYAAERMNRRMEAFERMLLPSIRAQTDPDFDFWILTSPELPDQWLERLDTLCADVPQITILMSDQRTVDGALQAPLMQAAEEAGRPPIQFRIDDDDALSRHFVARLRADARRFDDLPGFGLSQAGGFKLSSYGGKPVTFSRSLMNFTGAGVALRLPEPGRSIFSIRHFDIPRHLPAFSSNDRPAYAVIRWDAGDSVRERQRDKIHRDDRLTPEAFRQQAAEDFPFLSETDFSFIIRPDQG